MSEQEVCEYCGEPAIRFEQTLSRWCDRQGQEHVAHFSCDRAEQDEKEM